MITTEQLNKATDIARWIFDQTGETTSFDIKFNSYSKTGIHFSIWTIFKACNVSQEETGFYNFDTIEELIDNEKNIKQRIFNLILLVAKNKKDEENGN